MAEIPVFVSYGHIDNQPEPGWVTEFCKRLETRLRVYYGSDDVHVWRDQEITGSIWKTIDRQLEHAAVLVSIYSPRYVRSEPCLHELTEYYQACMRSRRFYVDPDNPRLVKVVKLPVTAEQLEGDIPEDLRTELKNLIEYRFYTETDKGAPIELDPESHRQEYAARLADLAYHINELITRQHVEGPPIQAARGTVYLAETAPDVLSHRDDIRRDLQSRGYKILPARQIDWSSPAFEQQVRDDLARSTLSIHLVGARRGIVPDEQQSGIAAVQLALAMQEQALRGAQVVWVPDGVTIEAAHDTQQRFLTSLIGGEYAGAGVEVLRGTIEELKTVVQDRLEPKPLPPAVAPQPVTPGAVERRRVYVIHHEADRDAARELIAQLEQRDIDVDVPLFEGDEAERARYHRELLQLCDAVLVYHGQATDTWLRFMLLEPIKARGYGRTTPFIAEALYLGPPETPSKRDFTKRQLLVMKRFDAFEPAALDPFVAALRRP